MILISSFFFFKSKCLVLIPLSFLFIFFSFASNGQTVRYVKSGASGDGSSWVNASGDLQLMINESSPTLGDSILVAEGIYYPNRRVDNSLVITPNDRNNCFRLKRNLKILGGYDSSELGTRNWKINKTILSGNIGNLYSKIDNSFHVVVALNVDADNLLDGFTIRDGNANGGETPENASGVLEIAGGGIYANNCYLNIANIIVNDNQAEIGGGIYCRSAPFKLNNAFIHSNIAGEGGGMFNSFSSDHIITNTEISGNTAGNGGGMCNKYSNHVLTNMLITGNKATQLGSAMYFDSNGSTLTNLTISGNLAGPGGGSLYLYSMPFSFYIHNSIIQGNSDGIQTNFTSPIIRYSIVQGREPGDTFFHNLSGEESSHFVLPNHFSKAPIIGGDYRLLGISRLIDKGNAEFYIPGQFPDLSLVTTDFDGAARLTGNSIDLGAYEFVNPCTENPVVYYVDSSLPISGNGLSWSTAFKTLGAALYAASKCANTDSILVAKGTYFPDRRADDQPNLTYNDRKNSFVLLPNVKILGGYPNGGGKRNPIAWPTILSGELGNKNSIADNAYHVVVSAGDVGEASMEGFIITKGNANGIETISDLIIVNGLSIYSFVGGGLSLSSSSPVFANLIVKENSARFGGGIANIFFSSPTLRNLNIVGNSASSNGGGIDNSYSNPVINNSSITGNYGYSGSAISNVASCPVLTNVTISGNRAEPNYGSVYNSDSSRPQIRNSIIFGNSSGLYHEPDYPPYNRQSKTTLQYSLVQGLPANDTLFNLSGELNPQFAHSVAFSNAPFITGDYNLQSQSPVINKGRNQLFKAGEIPDLVNEKTDLNGNRRIVGDTVDLGAYEFQFNLTSSLCIGSNGLLSSGISGQGLTYQWQIDSGSGYQNISDGTHYSGVHSDTLYLLNIPEAWHEFKFQCLINGGEQTSAVYTIKFKNVWLGLIDTAWENPANWSCGRAPDLNTDVVINEGLVYISENTVVKSLKLAASVMVIVRPGVVFTILQ